MKRLSILLSIVVLLVLSFLMISTPSSAAAVLVVDQSQTQYNGGSWMRSTWQAFVPSKSILARVDIYIAWDNSLPYTDSLTIHIRTSPTGSDLTSLTLTRAKILPVPRWVEFDIPDITVTPGTTYYIVPDRITEYATWGWGAGYLPNIVGPYPAWNRVAILSGCHFTTISTGSRW